MFDILKAFSNFSIEDRCEALLEYFEITKPFGKDFYVHNIEYNLSLEGDLYTASIAERYIHYSVAHMTHHKFSLEDYIEDMLFNHNLVSLQKNILKYKHNYTKAKQRLDAANNILQIIDDHHNKFNKKLFVEAADHIKARSNVFFDQLNDQLRKMDFETAVIESDLLIEYIECGVIIPEENSIAKLIQEWTKLETISFVNLHITHNIILKPRTDEIIVDVYKMHDGYKLNLILEKFASKNSHYTYTIKSRNEKVWCLEIKLEDLKKWLIKQKAKNKH